MSLITKTIDGATHALSYFTLDMVVLLRSKTLKVMFVGYVENELFVVDFSRSEERRVGKECRL